MGDVLSIVLHRWEYSMELRLSRCVPLPIGGVESHQWCVGCGCIVTDEELCRLKFPRENAFIDEIAWRKGCKTLEAGSG